MAVLSVDSLPLGFRFHPSDQELVNHYLKRKINGRINSDAVVVIPEVDVCKCEPWDLPGKSVIRSVDPEWFFFSPLDRKYTIGARQNRLTEAGYWKATGNDRKIKSRSGRQAAVIGLKKTLVFHLGRAPRGVRTCWIMHEYRTTEPEFDSDEKGQFVLCRLFKKPEGSNASPNADEVEIFPDTEHEAVALEDFAAPLNKELSEKNLQDNSQPLPVTADNQPVRDQKWMNDEAEYSTTYLSKPEDNHCNRNMTSAETFGDEAGLLQVDLSWLSASDFDQLGSGAVSPLPDMDFQFDDRFNQGFSREPLQDADADKDSLDEFLEAMLSNQEDSGTSSDIDTRPISSIVQHQASSKLTGGGSSPETVAHQVLQMASSKLTGGGSSPMAIAHQGFSMESLQDADADKDLLDESLEAMLSYQEDDFAELLYSGTSSNINTRLEAQAGVPLNDSRSVKMFHVASPQESIGQSFSSVNLSEFTRSSNDSFSTMEESTAQTYFTSSGIRIRNRQVDSSSNSIKEEQGLAIRRIRLQNSSRKSHVSTIELQMSDEVGEYSQHQIAGGEDSGPHHDDKPSVRSSVRLRKKSTKDTGDELEGKPLYPQVIRPGSVYIIRIVVIILVFLLLLCVWNMVPIKFMPYI